MKKIAYCTLGCKVNQYETEAMQQKLEQAGYETVGIDEVADIYIINTCTVTNMADRKSRQMLHKARRNNPNALVVAVGCYAQAAAEELEKDSNIDIIIGNNKKSNITEIIEAAINGRIENQVLDIAKEKEFEKLFIERVSEKTRAYIKIQDGCNQFCSYCIIPYARGRVRSREAKDIIKEVTMLSKNGYKEIVLTGIHIASYGVDLENMNLIELITELNSIEGIKRIRLGSIEPTLITEEFTVKLTKCEKICPHFHLSLQSGCDETLKRMNRKYTTADFSKATELLRKYFDKPAITTDIIVGFPQETEEEFEATRQFAEKIAFADVHIFKYSRRKGTVADKLEGQIRDDIKTKRSNVLIILGKKMTKEYQSQFTGEKEEVLFEEIVEIAKQRYIIGHTKRYVKVAIAEAKAKENEIKSVQIIGDCDNILIGEE